jgi:hypothetical protein
LKGTEFGTRFLLNGTLYINGNQQFMKKVWNGCSSIFVGNDASVVTLVFGVAAFSVVQMVLGLFPTFPLIKGFRGLGRSGGTPRVVPLGYGSSVV